MAYTQHDAIIKALVDVCLASPALAGGRVEEASEYDELPQNVDKAIEISLLDSLPQRRVYDAQDWQTTVRVSCRVRDDRRTAEGRPTAQLAAQVFSRVMASNKLGGLVETIEPPRLSQDLTLSRTRVGVLNMDFPMRHRTPAGTLI